MASERAGQEAGRGWGWDPGGLGRPSVGGLGGLGAYSVPGPEVARYNYPF